MGNTELHKYTGSELLQLCHEHDLRQLRMNNLRGSYKRKEPYVVYTCKLPKDMVEWLRQNDGSAIIRTLIKSLMSNGNSVIPIPSPPLKKSSHPSQCSPHGKTMLPKREVPIPMKIESSQVPSPPSPCYKCALPTTEDNHRIVTHIQGLPLEKPFIEHVSCERAEFEKYGSKATRVRAFIEKRMNMEGEP
jgi:hypothetical protein